MIQIIRDPEEEYLIVQVKGNDHNEDVAFRLSETLKTALIKELEENLEGGGSGYLEPPIISALEMLRSVKV